ncbi:hypothetical protein AURDEDRAFT_183951 [Auricularia subglabra TFB-10046 SS5]|nr:hypothetical protein AURDEDRAFT_183951 [Auricularia subglabra TFB-10046 SS5]
MFVLNIVALLVVSRVALGAAATPHWKTAPSPRGVGLCKGNPPVVYRAYSNETYDTDHLYTMDLGEAQNNRPRFHREKDCCRMFTAREQTDAPVVPFYRLWNKAHWDHFYTHDVAERAAALATGLFEDQGILGYVMTEAGCGSWPLYRAYRDDAYTTYDHFYTIDQMELIGAIATGKYKSEGIAAWVWPTCDLAPCWDDAE